MFRRLFSFVFFAPFFLNAQTAFIVGNDTICDNASKAIVKVDFTGNAPFTFSYSINGINQSSITTQNTSYLISTSIAGTYTLQNFNDAISVGTTSGSAIVTVLESPTAIIHLASDILSILYPIANFFSQSIGDIVSWEWSFGDNTPPNFSENPNHTYKDSLAIYQVSMIVFDNKGCVDTSFKHIQVADDFWVYIPNSFTPDKDGVNDKLCIEYHGIRENTFLFKVFNSQGNLMYQSTKPNELRCCIDISREECVKEGGWDGTYYKTSKKLPSDTYVYEIYFQDFEGWKHSEYGSIMLIR